MIEKKLNEKYTITLRGCGGEVLSINKKKNFLEESSFF